MLETASRDIDGIGFTIVQFPARKGLVIQARLAKILGPLLGGIAGALDGKSAQGNPDKLAADLARAVAGLSSLDAEEFMTLAVDMVAGAGTRMNNVELTPALFDLEFAGRYGTLYKLLAFITQHCFGSLFPAGDIGSLLAARVAGALKSQPAGSTKRSAKK